MIKDLNLGPTVLVSDSTWLKNNKIGSADKMAGKIPSNWLYENMADCLHFSLDQSDNKSNKRWERNIVPSNIQIVHACLTHQRRMHIKINGSLLLSKGRAVQTQTTGPATDQGLPTDANSACCWLNHCDSAKRHAQNGEKKLRKVFDCVTLSHGVEQITLSGYLSHPLDIQEGSIIAHTPLW